MKNIEVIKVFLSTYRNPSTIKNYKTKNLFFENNIIYSYGYHYPLAIKLADNKVIINKSGYSNSTSKHTNYIVRALTNNSLSLKELQKIQTQTPNLSYPYNTIILMDTEKINRFINFIKHHLSKEILEATSNDLALMELEKETIYFYGKELKGIPQMP